MEHFTTTEEAVQSIASLYNNKGPVTFNSATITGDLTVHGKIVTNEVNGLKFDSDKITTTKAMYTDKLYPTNIYSNNITNTSDITTKNMNADTYVAKHAYYCGASGVCVAGDPKIDKNCKGCY